MHNYLFNNIALFLVLIVTLIAGVPMLTRRRDGKKRSFMLSQAFASGIFLGAGLIHMLSDANNDFVSAGFHYPFAYCLAGAIFLFLLWIEHIGAEIQHHDQNKNHVVALITVVMLSIHSLLAGAALGLITNEHTQLLLLVAILAHKWAASYALATQLQSSSLSESKSYLSFTIFAVMTPLGIKLGQQITTINGAHLLWPAIFTALAAGTFLFIGTLHGLTRSPMIKQCCNLRQFTAVVLGFALMAVVAIWT